MRARTIDFTHEVRSGPKYSDRKQAVRLDDPAFKGGIIEVREKDRVVRLWNPKQDPLTHEPVETFVPFERVIGWEPLTKAQEAIFYPPPGKDEAAQ